jgi:repressor LexA
MEFPTQKQRDILGMFLDRWERGETPPTHREICTRFGFHSPKAAADHIAALKKKGYLMNALDQKRGVCLTEKAMGIPILGEIPAGHAVPTEEMTGEYLTFNSRALGLSNRRNAFFLRVKGDSMNGRHIFDGDLVLVEKSGNGRHQDVVAALIDNESTLKTLIQKDGSNWLRSENPKYPDLIPAWDLQIQGVARSVIRLLPT